MNLSQFEEACQRFDWQWYWRDSATVTAQTRLMNQALFLGSAFIATYENCRLKAQNPYCPLLKANLTVSTGEVLIQKKPYEGDFIHEQV